MRSSVFVLGTLAMIAQAAFLREVLATFRGGELTIGTALLFWLLWTAVGSGILGKFLSRTGLPQQRYHNLLPWYGVSGYLGVAIIADVPYIAHLTPGELVPFDVQFIALGLAFLPFNLLGGILFSLGVKALEKEKIPFAGHAFTLEASGAALAGVAISLFFITILSNNALALICPFVAFTAAAVWFFRHKRIISIFLLLFPIVFLLCVIRVNVRASNYMYRGQELLSQKDTRYGRLRVMQRGEIKTFYSDASILFSAPDPETSEYIVHIPMLAAPCHRNVLVLGGGPGGVIDEVLKYSTVEKVTCVELDPRLFELADQFLDEDWKKDPRVETVFADGRAFLESIDTGTTFDVIIMSMPPPLAGVTNRYYTQEFFKLASSCLSQEGVLGFSLTGSENYIPDDLALFFASIRTTLSSAFPSVTVLPGLTCRFLACNTVGLIDSLEWEDLTQRRVKRGVETAYVRDYFLRYTMSRDRMNFIRGELDAVDMPFINSDKRPIGFFSQTLLQGKLDGSRVLKFIEPLTDSRILFSLMILGLVLVSGYALIPGKGVLKRSIIATITSVGLTEISLEVLAIMAYQSVFGFLYSRIALLTGSYMAGLALGALAGTRKVEKGKAVKTHLITIQIFIAFIPILWIILLHLHTAISGHIPFLESMFYILTALSGLAGGMQFPVADALYRSLAVTGSSNRGMIYSVDLAGSSIGALFTASLMIPVLGMRTVLIFLSTLNIITAGALLLGSLFNFQGHTQKSR